MILNQKKYALANRGKRLAAVLLDVAVVFSILFLTGFLGLQEEIKISEDTATNIAFGMLIILFLVQSVLLTIKGQTIGKIILGIKIVKIDTLENGGFITNMILRTLLNYILRIVPFYGLIDILLIFNKDRRCIHDHIAGTIVVDLKKNLAYGEFRDVSNMSTEVPYISDYPASSIPTKNKTNKIALIIVTTAVIVLLLLPIPYIIQWFHNLAEETMLDEQKQSPNIIQSYNKDFIVFAPDGWIIGDNKINSDASLIIFSADEMRGFQVIKESKEDFVEGYTLKDYWEQIKKQKAEESTKIFEVKMEEEKINNYPVKRGYFDTTYDYIKYKFLITAVETPQNFYQISGWTVKSKFDQYQQEFIDITNSFKETPESNNKL